MLHILAVCWCLFVVLSAHATITALSDAFAAMIAHRHLILVDPHDGVTKICLESRRERLCEIKLLWRQNGGWQEVCPTIPARHALPRYWRLESQCYFPIFNRLLPALRLQETLWR